MALGDTVADALYNKLSPWLRDPPDYNDVQSAYKQRGVLQAQRVKLIRAIERVEDDVIAESDKPRSNETRVLKLQATKELRDTLAELDAQIAINENDIKLLEYRKEMFKVASYQQKVVADI